LTGGVIRIDPATGARTAVSENSTAGGPSFVDPEGIAVTADGSILVTDQTAFGGGGGVIRVDPATGARTAVSENSAPAGEPSFADPRGIALDATGSILVPDRNAFAGMTGGVIRVDPATGARTAVSENSSPAGGPSFADPNGIALDAGGSILVADFNAFGGGCGMGCGGVIRVDPATGTRTAVSENSAPPGAPSFIEPGGVAVEPAVPSLGSEKAKLKKKKIKLPVDCAPGAAACDDDEVELETVKPVKVRAQAAAKKKIVQLGSATFSIPAGQTQKVKVKVPRKGRKLFERKRKVKANATLTVTGPPLQSGTATEQVRVKAKKRGKK